MCLAQRDHGQPTAAQCLQHQEHGFWWHMAGPVPCSSKGQWGKLTAGAPREPGSFCLYKAREKCKISEARITLNLGNVLGRAYICNGNAKPLLQHRGRRRVIREATKEAVNVYSGLSRVYFILALLLEMDELI